MSFVQRLLRTTFTLADVGPAGSTSGFLNAGADSGSNRITLEGFRTSLKVVKAGGASMGTAQLRVNGMDPSRAQQLSTLGQLYQLTGKNTVIVEAGDASGMAVVFQGTANAAWVDYAGMPDVALVVQATTGGLESIAPLASSSFPASMDVATAISGIATQMGYRFSNSGVTAVLGPSYYSGSPRDQAYAMAHDAGINIVMDNGVLAIWPRGGSRSDAPGSGVVPVVSPETGMIGYPGFTANGLLVRTVFNPSIVFGGQIEVRSSVKPANGVWNVVSLDYDLDSLVPRGQWSCAIEAFNTAAPVPPR